jgi:RNA polymerase sigma-70 factor (ECF subfamily)
MMPASPPTDAELISRYLKMGDQRAFAALVRTHGRLVMGTAARVTGNVESARDVAQQVFAALAQKAWLLTDRTSLAGWLHHAARHIALRAARSEQARQRRHQQIAMDNPSAPRSDFWPVLEESLAALAEAEREAVVMHHLQDLSYEAMATALGLTEAAARKRVSRGLKGLEKQLRRRGFGGSAAALLAGAAAVHTGPPAAAAATTASAVAAAPLSLTLTTIMTHTVVKTAAVMFLVAAIPLAWLFHENSALRDQLAALQREVAARPVMASRTEAGARQAASAKGEGEPESMAASAPALDPAESKMVALMQRAKQMSTAAFGDRMAELLTATDSIETTTECTAMIAAINGERMAACYAAFKKRKGIPADQGANKLLPLLIAAGQRDGRNAVNALQAAGHYIPELSSLIHGWVLSEPGAAVSWFNEQNDKAPAEALSGLIWGLGQKDSNLAKSVFDNLNPEDQARSAGPLARSLLTTHGAAAVDSLIQGLPPELAQKCLDGAMERIQRRPPAEVVPWLAGKLATFPALSDNYETALQRWTITDPDAAHRWQAQALTTPPQ